VEAHLLVVALLLAVAVVSLIFTVETHPLLAVLVVLQVAVLVAMVRSLQLLAVLVVLTVLVMEQAVLVVTVLPQTETQVPLVEFISHGD
jgi:hypothetical protein